MVHEEGKKPELQSYKPDPVFPWKDEDKMKPRYKTELQEGKMSVLNGKNVHFNLIVGQTHMLSQYGSLSFQAAEQARKNHHTNIKDTRGPDDLFDSQPTRKASMSRAQGQFSNQEQVEKETLDSYKLKLKLRDGEIVHLKKTIAILKNKLETTNDAYDGKDIEELDG